MMHKYQLNYGLFIYVIAFFSKPIVSLRITKCGSNKISQIDYDNDSNKAVIEFDESNQIKVTESSQADGPFQFYCESDTSFESCSLVHESSRTSPVKCKYNVPPPCNIESTCEENKISYDADKDFKNCSFTLTRIVAAGK